MIDAIWLIAAVFMGTILLLLLLLLIRIVNVVNIYLTL